MRSAILLLLLLCPVAESFVRHRSGLRSALLASRSSDSTNEQRFAVGDELIRLRQDLDALRENLRWACAMGDQDRVDDLARTIRRGEERDPDIVYETALSKIASIRASTVFKKETKPQELEKWQREAQAARSSLERFQLDGLWVGNYGGSGEQLINITYVGDTLIATKVTGDVNVPRGETSFTVNLSPGNNSDAMEPLRVPLENGVKLVTRYAGKGQIAQENFTKKRFVEGMFLPSVGQGSKFSFLWVPTRHHVVFSRPSPEKVIWLLRDVVAKEDELENMRNHVSRCFDMDMTESLARFHAQQGQEPFRRIAYREDLEPLEAQDSHNQFSFWNVGKWRQYLENAITNPDSSI